MQDIEVLSPISATAEIKKYTLVGDDIYVKRYTNDNIPIWYRDMVSSILATDSTITSMDAAIAYLESLPTGYNIKLTNLVNKDLQIDTALTSLVTKDSEKTAAIANLNITKIDAASAQAISQATVASYFANGSAGSFFDSKIATYASNVAANASNISTLAATIGNQSVRIDTVDSVSATALGYSAIASKLITSPDGSITGWSFVDGTNTKSYFKINASSFKISDGTTGYTPFSIVGSNISFNGKVSFTNVTDVPALGSTPQQVIDAVNAGNTTTINGGKITTGSIWAGGKISGNGFMLNSQAAATSADPTIYGAYIKGGTVEGSVIRGATIVGAFIQASYVEFANAKTLTLWTHYGNPPNPSPPAEYLQNFAKDDLGVPIVDGNGYNRLVRSGPTASAGFNYTMPVHAYDWSANIPTHTTTLNGYGSYQTTSTLRCLSNGTTITVANNNAPLLYLELEFWTGLRGRITVVKDGVYDSIWFTYLYEDSAGDSSTKKIFRNGNPVAEQTVGHRTDMTFSVNGLSFSYKYFDDVTILHTGLYFNPSFVTFDSTITVTYSEFSTLHTNDGARWAGLVMTIPIMTAQ